MNDIVTGIATAAVGGFNPLSILAALVPLFSHAGNALISKYIAPDVFKPTSIDEYLSMRKAELDLFIALNSADGNQATYQWVAAIKQLQRPLVAFLVIGTWAGSLVFHFNTDNLNTFAQAIGFYLFADRSLFYSQQPGVKK